MSRASARHSLVTGMILVLGLLALKLIRALRI
jgi:hypothetical protein